MSCAVDQLYGIGARPSGIGWIRRAQSFIFRLAGRSDNLRQQLSWAIHSPDVSKSVDCTECIGGGARTVAYANVLTYRSALVMLRDCFDLLAIMPWLLRSTFRIDGPQRMAISRFLLYVLARAQLYRQHRSSHPAALAALRQLVEGRIAAPGDCSCTIGIRADDYLRAPCACWLMSPTKPSNTNIVVSRQSGSDDQTDVESGGANRTSSQSNNEGSQDRDKKKKKKKEIKKEVTKRTPCSSSCILWSRTGKSGETLGAQWRAAHQPPAAACMAHTAARRSSSGAHRSGVERDNSRGGATSVGCATATAAGAVGSVGTAAGPCSLGATGSGGMLGMVGDDHDHFDAMMPRVHGDLPSSPLLRGHVHSGSSGLPSDNGIARSSHVPHAAFGPIETRPRQRGEGGFWNELWDPECQVQGHPFMQIPLRAELALELAVDGMSVSAARNAFVKRLYALTDYKVVHPASGQVLSRNMVKMVSHQAEIAAQRETFLPRAHDDYLKMSLLVFLIIIPLVTWARLGLWVLLVGTLAGGLLGGTVHLASGIRDSLFDDESEVVWLGTQSHAIVYNHARRVLMIGARVVMNHMLARKDDEMGLPRWGAEVPQAVRDQQEAKAKKDREEQERERKEAAAQSMRRLAQLR